MKYSNVLFGKKDGTATITLNRPQALNAINNPLESELSAALQDAGNDESVRVIVIRGAGKCFCAGRDLREDIFEQMEDSHKIGAAALDPFEQVETIPKPVIAAVHGYAITGGFYLAGCCDIVIATEDARFADTHARWAIRPSGETTQRWSRKIGLMHAKYMMLTSKFITAREAYNMGLVAMVVPDGKLDDGIKEVVDSLLANSSRSMAHIKMMMNRGNEVDFATALRMEAMMAKWGPRDTELDNDRQHRLTEFKEKKRKATK